MSPLSRRRFLGTAAVAGGMAGAGALTAFSHWAFPSFSSLFGGSAGLTAFQPPDAAEIDDVSHVLNRLTFGPRPGDHDRVSRMGARSFIAEQLDPESLRDVEAVLRSRHFESLEAWPPGELLEYSPLELLDQLTRDKILRALHSRRQLFEVMVDFWSDHFNIDPSKGDSRWLKPVDDRRVIRAHAMGRFGDLVRASALSPAMLWYLDGRENRRATPGERPNENYARELLELHTLGVHGGYTQDDVMEVARCLTGWTVRARDKSRLAIGKVEFNPSLHDDGPKRVLGVAIPAGLGRGDLDRVIEIVAHHPSTARHLAEKLCRRFINDDPPAAAVAAVAEAFSASRGELKRTLAVLFEHQEFWAARGNKVKRPFHFVLSSLRVTDARTNAGRPVQEYLLRLGHAPFQYPTPDGYPEETPPWMATLLWRWRFAADLAANGLKGTHFNPDRLRQAAGDTDFAVAAHVLGRQPSAAEIAAAQQCASPMALLLASPAFQVY
ncbi:MAG: DUF1800 domain-containing protein [Verrucomicrobiales bacterium]